MTVESTTERVLRLLFLLLRRPAWRAAELAVELGVTERSVRRDVGRLRALGYPVRSTPGVGGGYQLGAGARMPPLLLDDEEAVAAAVSLRLGTGGTVAGEGEAALRALAKLDQVMPPRLRSEVRAVQAATDALPRPGVGVDPDLLLVLARACRDEVRVRFGYTSRSGEARRRTVEPVRMVATAHRWYLMAWDVDRADWRVFRLDRLADLETTTWRFPARPHPDPVDYVQHSVTAAPYRHLARVRVHAPAEEVAAQVPPQVGRIEEDREQGWCVLVAGADRLDAIAVHIAMLGYEAQVLEPEELRAVAAGLGRRLMAMGADTAADEAGTDEAGTDEAERQPGS
jgi:predicted DNA-binding transcriptional regulator YafY